MKFKRLLLICILFSACLLTAANTFPRPTGWVNDFAGVLSPEVKTELTNWFTEVKEKTDVEMAVAIFPNLGGADYENFATDLFRNWGVGNSNDEGVLLLISVQERKIKFEVGYGSEGYLTDYYTNEVLKAMQSLLAPGKENYDAAVKQAALMLLNRIAEEKGVQLTGVPHYNTQDQNANQSKVPLLIVLVFIALIILTRGRILYWLFFLSFFGGGSGRGGFGGFGNGGGGFGGFGGFGGGRSGGGGAGGGF